MSQKHHIRIQCDCIQDDTIAIVIRKYCQSLWELLLNGQNMNEGDHPVVSVMAICGPCGFTQGAVGYLGLCFSDVPIMQWIFNLGSYLNFNVYKPSLQNARISQTVSQNNLFPALPLLHEKTNKSKHIQP